ncbi:MAG TPA: DUF5996 family protein [Terracidiphilus sp.]|nr:DUF5996 family protein [Terracidiphilus sp.]
MTSQAHIDSLECWPALPYASWQATCETLHMWTQIVGKVRLALTPPINHFWNVPLYVSTRGLTTSALPWHGSVFELEFDFTTHNLVLQVPEGQSHVLPLKAQPVAEFYRALLTMLRDAGIELRIWKLPVEVPNPIPFDQDFTHASYDRDAVLRFWQILVSTSTVFNEFRSRFIGKCSPVHFFWGSFDLAVTRFSGRRAPERPGADAITREAYSHEVSSVGFWPGAGLGNPAFYSYAAPEPEGFSSAAVRPSAAHYDPSLKEFILMYDDVRRAASPSAALFDFCESTYGAAANLANWDREALERATNPLQ